MSSIKQVIFSPLFLAIFFAQTLISQESYLLNYDDVDIRKVTQDIARFAKKTIILDPRVKGKVTIFSDTLLDEEQVWQVYLRTAQVNGFSTINEGSIVRIVPENEATRDSNLSNQGGDFVTKIFLLENRTAAELLPMLKPITGRQAHLSSIPSINSIILVDRKSNVDRIQLLINELDMNDSSKISIIKLK
ncbi:MAG TPA: type II secretion system protein GspD, partial [Gammaproteobacteria bacterium]|nr:type II secretion system protein GspD [Gammaproteobacteria bacterium]